MTQKIFDDAVTVLKSTVNATRPATIYVADTLDLAGGELSATFDIRMEDELLRVTAVVLDDPVAGTDKWTVSHLGGAAASGHDAGVEVEFEADIIDDTESAGTAGQILTKVSGHPRWATPAADDDSAYALLAGATFTGDVELEAQLVDDTEASGSDGDVLTKVSGHPRWAALTGGG